MRSEEEFQAVYYAASEYLKQSKTPLGWLRLHCRSVLLITFFFLLTIFVTYNYALAAHPEHICIPTIEQ